MKPTADIYKKAIALFIFLTFLSSQGVSFFASPKAGTSNQTTVYQFNEVCPVIPYSGTEVFTGLAFVLLVIFSFHARFQISQGKIQKQLLFPVYERNSFYRNITIHAP